MIVLPAGQLFIRRLGLPVRARPIVGVIIIGGPIASDDESDIALMAVQAEDADAVRSIFDDDPWTVHRMFLIKDVRAWSLWLDGRSR